jgi:hypothetical protein
MSLIKILRKTREFGGSMPLVRTSRFSICHLLDVIAHLLKHHKETAKEA